MHSSTARTSTPLGVLEVAWSGDGLRRVALQPDATAGSLAPMPPAWLAEELAAYFRDGRHRFSLPLQLTGTAFQQRVWSLLRAIPPGRTRTYGEIAAELGSGARAVGNACRANPCPIVVPCHRVVGRADLGGFAGDTDGRLLRMKRWLLAHEDAGHRA